VFNNNISFITE